MVWCSLAALPAVGRSQTTLLNQPVGVVSNPTAANTQAGGASAPVPETALVGTTAFDIITLTATGPATPLRYGGVVPGSERVELSGERLKAVDDYAIDNAAGVIYLLRPQKAGQTLTVNYRYDPKGAAASGGGSNSFQGLQTLKYQISPSINMLMGLGLAERASDGTVLSSNLIGWNNNFSMGSGKLAGLFVVGDRQKQVNSAGLQMDTANKPGTASNQGGQSDFILQNFRTGLLGGNVDMGYQSISKNFSGFSQVSAAGYDDATVKNLQAERGLERTGMSLSGLKFGALQLSSSEKTVKDGSNAIQWQSLGLAEGGMKIDYTSRDVSRSFSRFQDISEADKAQLKNETGISRQDLAASFNQKVGSLSFDSMSIKDDATGQAISKRDFQFTQGATKLDFGDQDVTANFSRFGSLLAPEKAVYGKEAGLRRQWLALDTAVMGKSNTLSFHEMELGGATGQFRADTASYVGKTWSIQRIDQSASRTFSGITALQDSEQDANIKQIASMYGTGIATTPGDRGQYALGAGLSRSYTAFGAQPFKSWNLNFSQLDIKGNTGGITTQTGTVSSKNLQFTYKHEDFASQFNQVTSLLALEQQRVGSIAGLDRTDMALNMTLGGARKLTATRLASNDPSGNALRDTVNYVDKKIDVSLADRQVATAFGTTGQFVDPETALLNSIRGYREQDAHVKWQLAASMKLDSQVSQATNLSTGKSGEFDNTVLDWAVNKNTQLQFVRQDGRNSDPLNTMFSSLMQKLSLTENLGKYGKVQYIDQEGHYAIPGGTLPDYHTQYVSYETKIGPLTSIKTEQTLTSYGNGGSETIDANTVSQAISKRAGVSVTNTQITAKGETQQDETKQNYGFWYDIGNGLRISYGHASDLNGPQATSTNNSTFAVGKNADTVNNSQLGALQQGQLGSFMVGGGYGANQWVPGTGQDRTQSFSNVGLDTAKPINIGFLKQVTLKVSSDTASDYSAWLRENRLMSVHGKIGPDSFGLDYRSQMQSNGDRGVDRGISFATDQNPKDWIRASISYKERTLPGDQTFAIRDISVTAKPTKKIEITNQLQTNPEVVRTDLILGTLPQASRSNKWKFDYLTDVKTTLGWSWEELRNDTNGSIARTAGLNAKLFGNTASPVTLFYGLQQSDALGTLRHTIQRYSLQYNQKAGPRQAYSMFLGNVTYDDTLDPGLLKNNWTVRVDWQIKF